MCTLVTRKRKEGWLCYALAVTLLELTIRFALAVSSGAIIVIPALVVFARWVGARFAKVTDAYAEERAKLLAQSHNLEKLIEQTATLTAATEAIKTQLTGEEWNRQQRVLKRIDTYSMVIEAIQKLLHTTKPVQAWAHTVKAHRNSPDPQLRLQAMTKLNEATTSYNASFEPFSHAFSLAQLTCSSEAIRVLHKFALPLYNDDNLEEKMEEVRNLAIQVLNEFIAAARNDIGYEPLIVSATLIEG